MQITRIPFAEVPQFSRRDVAYATGHADFDPFIKYPVTLEAFADVMRDKAEDQTDRQLLVDELLAQYEGMQDADGARTQVRSLLNGDAFTVITAHQPSLFTGPLYFIHKICSTINLSRQLNERYPAKHIVPIFIVGGEDHDFDEINHARVNGRMITWEQTTGGSVSALSTDTLGPALNQLRDLLGSDYSPDDVYRRLRTAYTKHKTYGEATVAFVHDLFKHTELVVANPSRPAFKRAFLPYMEREIFEQVSQPLVEKAQARITAAGYGGQAHAREINLFYLQPGRRDRIVYQDGHYGVLDTSLLFTAAEFRAHLREFPERFSPNVVMRPIFQELIFPNLAYVGGGGEIAYWLERKEQFAAFGLNFPMLIRRNSALWIDKRSGRKLDKLGLDLRELMVDPNVTIRNYVAQRTENELSLAPELEALADLFNAMALKAKAIDPTLEAAALAEHSRQEKIVVQFESRLRRIEKRKFQSAMDDIKELSARFFPNGGLQERTDNFLTIYLDEGQAMFDVLIDALDPLTEGMVVVRS